MHDEGVRRRHGAGDHVGGARREVGDAHVGTVQVGEAVEAANLAPVELFEGRALAEIVDTDFRREHGLGPGLPAEVRGVPEAGRDQLFGSGREAEARGRPFAIRRRFARVAVGADRRAGLAVRTEPKRSSRKAAGARERDEGFGFADHVTCIDAECCANDVGGSRDKEVVSRQFDSVEQTKVVEEHARLVGAAVAVRDAQQQHLLLPRLGHDHVAARRDARIAGVRDRRPEDREDEVRRQPGTGGPTRRVRGVRSGPQHLVPERRVHDEVRVRAEVVGVGWDGQDLGRDLAALECQEPTSSVRRRRTMRGLPFRTFVLLVHTYQIGDDGFATPSTARRNRSK